MAEQYWRIMSEGEEALVVYTAAIHMIERETGRTLPSILISDIIRTVMEHQYRFVDKTIRLYPQMDRAIISERDQWFMDLEERMDLEALCLDDDGDYDDEWMYEDGD
ncbi:TPA_asm: P7 [Kobresia betacytorhabdovirus 1]|nr:TPA_asm: P7 [Kobresia betacytorhabdovirus 1]